MVCIETLVSRLNLLGDIFRIEDLARSLSFQSGCKYVQVLKDYPEGLVETQWRLVETVVKNNGQD